MQLHMPQAASLQAAGAALQLQREALRFIELPLVPLPPVLHPCRADFHGPAAKRRKGCPHRAPSE